MSTKNPFLYFNFANDEGVVKPLTFTGPTKIIETTDPNEVVTCLKQVERAINDGYYAAGYIAYEAASSFYPDLSFSAHENLPLLWFGIFKQPTESMDHNPQSFQITSWESTQSKAEYYKAFEEVHTYIKRGETDQVNFTTQMEADFSGDSFAFFKQLEEAQAANYAAFLKIDDFSILSASPELFFHLKDNKITTKPMKGTVERGKTYEEDVKNAQWLKNSEKNRHENELIVQLMKEELTKIAQQDTVKVSQKFEVEQYPTLYQMTSTVTAEVDEKISITKLFEALFPCGSITGLPKQRTMELISQHEINPRGIYCGAIGFFTPQHEAIFNVPIRTVLINHQLNKALYGVGGAITIDSTKKEEYEEIITKAAVLTESRESFSLLETLLLQNGSYFVLENHIKRLKNSARYFNYSFCEDELREMLKAIANEYSNNQWKIRVLLDQTGKISIKPKKITSLFSSKNVLLANKPIKKDNPFLYHKTTNRTVYDEHRADRKDAFDVLLWNEAKQITEFTTGNIVAEQDGVLITPPVTCGLLPGTFRGSLLKEGKIIERVIAIDDLPHLKKLWFINSVRKWVPVQLS